MVYHVSDCTRNVTLLRLILVTVQPIRLPFQEFAAFLMESTCRRQGAVSYHMYDRCCPFLHSPPSSLVLRIGLIPLAILSVHPALLTHPAFTSVLVSVLAATNGYVASSLIERIPLKISMMDIDRAMAFLVSTFRPSFPHLP